MKVMAFGTFDIVHPGHEFYLQKAKELGDELVVVIARDSTVKKVKGRLPHKGEAQRLEDVRGLGIADKVMLGDPEDELKAILEERPGMIALGYDQRSFTDGLVARLKERGLDVKLIRIDPYKPDEYKSSIFKRKMGIDHTRSDKDTRKD